MPNAALIVLSAYTDTPKEYIGKRAADLGQLHKQNIPIPRSFCVPEPTLKVIAEANKLAFKVSQVLNKADYSSNQSKSKLNKELVNIFTRLHLPRNISSEIITHYHDYLDQDYVHVLPSNSPNHYGDWVHDNVKGDANVIDSLLRVWAEVVYTNSLYSPQQTPVQTILFSSPLLVEWAPKADASGVVFTKDPTTGSKTEMAIHGTWGIYHPDHSQDLDVIKVDVRTWNVTSQQIANKNTKLSRGLENLKRDVIPTPKQGQAILERHQAEQLARIVFNIKQHSLKQLMVHWMLVSHQLLITAIEPILSLVPDKASRSQDQNSRLKSPVSLYISAGNPNKAGEQISDFADGIGVLRSEYTIAKFGMHPQHVLKSDKHKTLLKDDLIKTVKTYQKFLGDRPLIYRTQNFTSEELRRLQFSDIYEPEEKNPYLGYRGGLKIASQPDLFAFELGVLKNVLETSAPNTQLGCMLPFVRSPGELRAAIDQVTKLGLLQKSNFKVWMQLNTPGNILNLAAYPLQQVTGISLNVRSLHGLITGVDPDNNELMSRYPLPTKILIHLLKHTLKTIQEYEHEHPTAHKLKVFVHMENYSHDITTEAVKLGVNGIIVKPLVAQLARECIIDTEAFQFGTG